MYFLHLFILHSVDTLTPIRLYNLSPCSSFTDNHPLSFFTELSHLTFTKLFQVLSPGIPENDVKGEESAGEKDTEGGQDTRRDVQRQGQSDVLRSCHCRVTGWWPTCATQHSTQLHLLLPSRIHIPVRYSQRGYDPVSDSCDVPGYQPFVFSKLTHNTASRNVSKKSRRCDKNKSY